MNLRLDKTLCLGLMFMLFSMAAFAQAQIHTVKKGDTLYSLARSYGVTVEHIQKLNGLSGSALSIGQKLKIRETQVATPVPIPTPAPTPPTPVVTPLPIQEPQVPTPSPTDHSITSPRPIPKSQLPDDYFYEVARGDNLYRISINHGVKLADMLAWNGFSDSGVSIFPGQRLIVKDPATFDPDLAPEPKPVTPAQIIPATPAKPDTVVIEKVYIVQKKDTLYKIATENGMTVDALKKLNGLTSNDLRVGQRIYLAGTPRPQTGSVPSVSLTEDDLLKKDRIRNDLVMPVEGRVLSEYGLRNGNPHKGIDIGAKTGTPIYAVLDGTVVFSGVQGAYGNVVVIEHPDFVMTVYAHNEKNLVSVNDVVSKGQQIATIGATGNATGPHIHFEYRIKGKAINPRKVLPLN